MFHFQLTFGHGDLTLRIYVGTYLDNIISNDQNQYRRGGQTPVEQYMLIITHMRITWIYDLYKIYTIKIA